MGQDEIRRENRETWQQRRGYSPEVHHDLEIGDKEKPIEETRKEQPVK